MFVMAKLTLFNCAPLSASRIARPGPATRMMCCLALSCMTPTGASLNSPSSVTRTFRLRSRSCRSRSRMLFVMFLIFFLRSTFSSMLAESSAPLSRSSLASTAKSRTAPKLIARLTYSALRSTSSRTPPMAAMTPLPVNIPLTKAPEAAAPYRNRRRPRHGATVSSRSLFDTPLSNPPDRFLSSWLSSVVGLRLGLAVTAVGTFKFKLSRLRDVSTVKAVDPARAQRKSANERSLLIIQSRPLQSELMSVIRRSVGRQQIELALVLICVG
mmetsp:Transcript_36060/g.82305  ORF Transcript_36060/g.82305 Transcript_36060/m.82305 type:complete len:270 (-) Transcript_36060:36-845(-)